MTGPDASPNGVQPVSRSDRNYGFLDLFWNWFGDGSNASSWYFGGLLALAGLPFLFFNTFVLTPLVILPWATLAYIAYRYGATTVVLARPVLGMRGSNLLLGISETVVQIGWTTVTTYIGAASLVRIWETASSPQADASPGKVPLAVAILAIAVLQGIVASLGHVSIKILKWVSSLLLLGFGGIETWHVLNRWNLHQILSFHSTASSLSVPQLIDITFINIWTWLQVGDFARFSKSGTGAALGSWLGLWVGQAWFVLVGAVGVIGIGLARGGELDPSDADPSQLMASLGLSYVALFVILLSSVSVSASNLYGAGMALLAFARKKNRTLRPFAALSAVSTVQVFTAFIPLFFVSFIGYFTDFLTTIGGVFIPLWTLVLVDYLLFRKGRFHEESLFAASSEGSYWFRNGFNVTGILSLGTGILFFYGVGRIVPGWISKTGVSIPTILWTGVVYVLLYRSTLNGKGSFGEPAE
jgi:NCS1 family nucleobase:cation symporter-1